MNKTEKINLFCFVSELYEESNSYDYESTLATHFLNDNDYESTLATHVLKNNDYESTHATHVFKNNDYESTLANHVKKCPRVHPRLTSPRLRVVIVRRVEVWFGEWSVLFILVRQSQGLKSFVYHNAQQS